jgi:hypothetical protein
LERRSYQISMVFNGIYINKLIIDGHYEEKHPEMSDDIILNLIKNLNGCLRKPVQKREEFSYYVEDPALFNDKPYRLIMVSEEGKQYLGIVNAFRVKEK